MKKIIFGFLFISIAVLASNKVSAADFRIVTLPQTFNQSLPGGYIDLNNDRIPDFRIRIYPGEYAQIRGMSPLDSPIPSQLTDMPWINSIIAESTGEPEPPQQGLEELEGPVITGTFTSLLTRGDLIGPVLTSPQKWSSRAEIFGERELVSPALGSTWANGLNKGYVGVLFYVGSQLYYGWLNVEIDPNQMWVKVYSSGYASAPSTPVPAGLNDPYAVPVPLIASILGFGLIGGGVIARKRRKK